jgi:hypothetical protein
MGKPDASERVALAAAEPRCEAKGLGRGHIQRIKKEVQDR